MRVWIWVIIGAVLPLLLGAGLGSITTVSGRGTWGYPLVPAAFLVLGIGLAASHLLAGLAYRAVARIGAGRATAFSWAAFAGSLLLAACELWSGMSAELPLGSSSLVALEAGYLVGGAMVVIGSLGAGTVLRSSHRAIALPLIVVGAALALAMIVKYSVGDEAGIAALTTWSLLYLWLALSLRSLPRVAASRRTGAQQRIA